jgi:GcrA cell cycle regulator
MRLRKSKPWTDADNERLKALVASGASAFRAAAAFDRTIVDIRERARKLGTPLPTLREARKKVGDSSSSSSWRQY